MQSILEIKTNGIKPSQDNVRTNKMNQPTGKTDCCTVGQRSYKNVKVGTPVANIRSNKTYQCRTVKFDRTKRSKTERTKFKLWTNNPSQYIIIHNCSYRIETRPDRVVTKIPREERLLYGPLVKNKLEELLPKKNQSQNQTCMNG